MASDRPESRGFSIALAAYALYAAGCHGWVPALLQGFLLLVAGALLLSLAGPSARSPALFWLRFVPFALGVWARQVADVDLLATLGLLAGLVFVAPGTARSAIARALLAVALVGLALSTTLGFHFEEALAAGLGAIASTLSGHDVNLGPVYGGGRAVLIGTAVLLAVSGARGATLLVRTGVLLALAVVVTGAVAMIAAALPSFGSTPSIPPIRSVVAAQLPWLPFLLGIAAVPLLVRPPAAAAEVRSRDRLTGVLAFAAAVCVLASLPPAPVRAAEKVVFYRPGFSNWEVAEPDLERAGPYSTGMLGTLPQFARAMGLAAELVDTIDADTLESADVLVIVNQDSPLSGSKAEVERWLQGGGHLVVAGDHTFIQPDDGGWTNYLNETLAGSGIRFPNNSSDHLTRAVLDATITTGLGRRLDSVPGNPYSPIIGAGLEVRWPARPIVIGRHCYEDAGVVPAESDGKAIGDLTWNPGERLGGVVQLAEQQVGAGRVTVIGDTTGIHNIARSIVWRPIGNLMLGRDRDNRFAYWLAALALLGLSGFCLLRAAPALPVAIIASAALGAVAVAGNLDRAPVPLSNPDEPLLILDLAVKPSGQRGEWNQFGYLTLISSAMRVGHLPLFTSTKEHGIPPGTRVILVSRPQVHPGKEWRDRLLGWVRDGGHLVFAGAYDAQLVLGDLLAEVGCRIEPLVIGPQAVRVSDTVGQSFVINFQESWNLKLLEGEWAQLVYGEETTTMASRVIGAGKVTIVTDQTFLQNRNQENEDIINKEALRFMMSLLGGEGAQR